MIESPLTRVSVRDLCLFAHHGVLEEEKRLGQRFFINIDALVNIDPAIKDDDYHQAVCYAGLCDIASEITRGSSFNLIETLADRIASAILERYSQVVETHIEIRKPSAPLPYTVSEAAIKITKKRHEVVGLSLGANLGPREATLKAAIDMLARAEGLQIDRVSGLYDSAPWGVEDQPPFINLCLLGQTSLRPMALLRLCKEIELLLGRIPGRHWGERALDIDLLFYGEMQIDNPVLTLPHPRIFERAFVLEPLYELDPTFTISGRNISEALAQLARTEGDVVRRAGAPFPSSEESYVN
ncbi:2-amino-4-hydroxy-6-hydroxymethyldihydropteridine diphosphokinase [Aristophania vespae]|uniref:Bifunctional folate synthesis protein n=1 Tax=Aristophania vespae TaxID=2697033 RepID=A0A6P1NF89_9PROT|nr:2-amino-4-hydroxy-6-hydroxymethyldihydropteridine diphosphokinase [Aristophania vespae]QHI96118.1 2-amino-4-hydroxy-6-hydroxymethyldihydropteridine diphosphokinase [Aristophania vespae]UMM63893.1 Bifunctional folate synthesis protein [Aristophania vespae]